MRNSRVVPLKKGGDQLDALLQQHALPSSNNGNQRKSLTASKAHEEQMRRQEKSMQNFMTRLRRTFVRNTQEKESKSDQLLKSEFPGAKSVKHTSMINPSSLSRFDPQPVSLVKSPSPHRIISQSAVAANYSIDDPDEVSRPEPIQSRLGPYSRSSDQQYSRLSRSQGHGRKYVATNKRVILKGQSRKRVVYKCGNKEYIKSGNKYKSFTKNDLRYC